MEAVLLVLGTITLAGAQTSTSARGQGQHALHDQNKDGICDICSNPVGSGRVDTQGRESDAGKHFGPGDGTGNMGTGPRDGSGYGSQVGKRAGSVDCTVPGVSQGQGAGTGAGQGRGRRGSR